MRIRPKAFAGAACLLLLSVSWPSFAQQANWLKDLSARLPQFTVRATPISRQGTLSPDGKWLAIDVIVDPGINEPGTTGTYRYGIEILDRTGKVVQEVTRDNPSFVSVNRFVWGRDSQTLYFEHGDRMHPGSRNIVDGPVIWKADLGNNTKAPLCIKTSFTQMPISSPRADSYLIEDGRERAHLLLVGTKRKTRILFRDAALSAWSPNGRRILLVGEPPADKGQSPYFRTADSRSGSERAFTAAMPSAAEKLSYGWVSAHLVTAYWLADSTHLLTSVFAMRKDGVAARGCFVTSLTDGSHSLIPDIYPLSGSCNGRTILIERPDKKLFLLDILPKKAIRR